MTQRSLLLLLCLLLTLVGCKKSSEDAPAEAPAAQQATEAPDEATAPVEDAAPEAPTEDAAPQAVAEARPFGSLELLSQGAEPRRLLRYDLAALRPVTMTMTMTMQISSAGQVTPVPATLFEIHIHEVAMQEDGRARISFRMDGGRTIPGSMDQLPNLTPEQIADLTTELNNQLSSLILSGSYLMDARGQVTDHQFVVDEEQLPPGLGDTINSMQQSMQQINAALPEEPVGVGAQWRLNLDMTGMDMPIEMQSSSTITLESIEGQRLNMSAVYSFQAPAQPLVDPSSGARLGTIEIPLRSAEGHIVAHLDSLNIQNRTAVVIQMLMTELPGPQPSITSEMSMTVDIATQDAR